MAACSNREKRMRTGVGGGCPFPRMREPDKLGPRDMVGVAARFACSAAGPTGPSPMAAGAGSPPERLRACGPAKPSPTEASSRGLGPACRRATASRTSNVLLHDFGLPTGGDPWRGPVPIKGESPDLRPGRLVLDLFFFFFEPLRNTGPRRHSFGKKLDALGVLFRPQGPVDAVSNGAGPFDDHGACLLAEEAPRHHSSGGGGGGGPAGS